MSQHVAVTREGGIVEIRFDRPEKKNAITIDMYAALADVLEAADGDTASRVVLFTGAPEVFTSGNDLKDFLDAPPSGTDHPIFRFLLALHGLRKVAVAAVNGPAIGIGTTLLLHCDLVVAGRGARFQLPFVNLGLVPEAASSLLLPRIVGHVRASELLLLGEPFGADEALAMGLVNRVVDDGETVAAARALAAQVAAKPPAAVRLTKRLLRSDTATVPARMEEEAGHFGAQIRSPEAREAMQAFLERRAPDFSSFA